MTCFFTQIGYCKVHRSETCSCDLPVVSFQSSLCVCICSWWRHRFLRHERLHYDTDGHCGDVQGSLLKAVSVLVRAHLWAHVRMSVEWKVGSGIWGSEKHAGYHVDITHLFSFESHTNLDSHQQLRLIPLPSPNPRFYPSFSFLPIWLSNNATSLLFWFAFSWLLMRCIFSYAYPLFFPPKWTTFSYLLLFFPPLWLFAVFLLIWSSWYSLSITVLFAVHIVIMFFFYTVTCNFHLEAQCRGEEIELKEMFWTLAQGPLDQTVFYTQHNFHQIQSSSAEQQGGASSGCHSGGLVQLHTLLGRSWVLASCRAGRDRNPGWQVLLVPLHLFPRPSASQWMNFKDWPVMVQAHRGHAAIHGRVSNCVLWNPQVSRRGQILE